MPSGNFDLLHVSDCTPSGEIHTFTVELKSDTKYISVNGTSSKLIPQRPPNPPKEVRGPLAIGFQPEGGFVGIGTSMPSTSLEVVGPDENRANVIVTGRLMSNSLRGGGLYVDEENRFIGSDARSGVGFYNHGWRLLVMQTGNIGIGTTDPKHMLHVEGDIYSKGDLNVGGDLSVANHLHLSGNMNASNIYVINDITLANADCAEDFEITSMELVEPGMVMVINSDGKLKPAEQAYDKRVAGVISGAGEFRPGIVLGKKIGEINRLPLALNGRVYCKVDAQYGSIQVGDLLTTSPTCGYAMKSADPQRAFGAILGKALAGIDGGQGLIPVLVALQ